MRDRKAANIARKAAKKASHKASSTVVHMKAKKRSKSVKMASTNVKKAA